MAFIQIPPQHTEEEKLLQQKYQKLKRKKKLLQNKVPKIEQNNLNTQNLIKRESTKQDAKEIAKKLLKSGAISAIKAPDRDRKGQGFKKSKALERKRIGADKPAGFKPFQSDMDKDMNTSFSEFGSVSPTNQYKNFFNDFSNPTEAENYARKETHWERKKDGKANYVNRDIPNQGNSIYVSGQGLDEVILKKNFSSFGSITNINLVPEKSCGFITFETIEQANEAIKDMDGKYINNAPIKVSLARRQPSVNVSQPVYTAPTASSTASSWGMIASNFAQKGYNNKDDREIITYDDFL